MRVIGKNYKPKPDVVQAPVIVWGIRKVSNLYAPDDREKVQEAIGNLESVRIRKPEIQNAEGT